MCGILVLPRHIRCRHIAADTYQRIGQGTGGERLCLSGWCRLIKLACLWKVPFARKEVNAK